MKLPPLGQSLESPSRAKPSRSEEAPDKWIRFDSVFFTSDLVSDSSLRKSQGSAGSSARSRQLSKFYCTRRSPAGPGSPALGSSLEIQPSAEQTSFLLSYPEQIHVLPPSPFASSLRASWLNTQAESYLHQPQQRIKTTQLFLK